MIKAEEAARLSEERYRELLTSATSGLGYLLRQVEYQSASTLAVLKEMGEAARARQYRVHGLTGVCEAEGGRSAPDQIEPLIREALRFVKHELSAAKVKAATHFAGQLPRCALDRMKMKQALVNLFTNACHAMSGGGTLDITTPVWALKESDALPPFRSGDFAVVVEIARWRGRNSLRIFSKIFDPYFTAKPPGKRGRARPDRDEVDHRFARRPDPCQQPQRGRGGRHHRSAQP